jgi:hypothetical protein
MFLIKLEHTDENISETRERKSERKRWRERYRNRESGFMEEKSAKDRKRNMQIDDRKTRGKKLR